MEFCRIFLTELYPVSLILDRIFVHKALDEGRFTGAKLSFKVIDRLQHSVPTEALAVELLVGMQKLKYRVSHILFTHF